MSWGLRTSYFIPHTTINQSTFKSLKHENNMKHPNLIKLELDADFTTRGKVIDVVYLDGKTERIEPTPLEESEQSRKLRAEIFNEFRQYGRMPVLWRDILKE